MPPVRLNRLVACRSVILLVLSCLLAPGVGFGNQLSKIRAYLYDVDQRPTSIRLALDFTEKAEEMVVQVPGEKAPEVPDGYRSEFVIVTLNAEAVPVIQAAEIDYGNTDGLIHIQITEHEIHVAVQSEYELNSSSFNYIPENRVAYTDFEVASREVDLAEQAPAETLQIESIPVQVTTAALADSLLPDTTTDSAALPPPVQVVEEASVGRLQEIVCQYFVHWWHEPHFQIDFMFDGVTDKLSIVRANLDQTLVPDGYEAQYVVGPALEDSGIFRDDVKVDCAGTDDGILLKIMDEKCYLLARRDLILKPQRFIYDDRAGVAYIRINYARRE